MHAPTEREPTPEATVVGAAATSCPRSENRQVVQKGGRVLIVRDFARVLVFAELGSSNEDV